MSTSHVLSALEPLVTNTMITTSISNSTTTVVQSNRSPELDRNLCVTTLDDRDLWLRFQNLTNEMIVTKNGR